MITVLAVGKCVRGRVVFEKIMRERSDVMFEVTKTERR